MVPPPLYRDGRYNMNQTVINTVFPGSGPASIRGIAESPLLRLPPSRIIDLYRLLPTAMDTCSCLVLVLRNSGFAEHYESCVYIDD